MFFDNHLTRLLLTVWICSGLYLINAAIVYTEVGGTVQMNFTTSESFPLVYVLAVELVQRIFTFGKFGNTFIVPQNVKHRIENIKLYENNTGVSMTLRNILLDDAGSYKIVGKATTPSNITLVVVSKPDNLRILPASSEPPTVNQSYTIQCEASSTSKPDGHGLLLSYTWKESNSALTSISDRYNISGSHLEIKRVRKEDDDLNFSCQASESGGDITVISDESPVYTFKPHYAPTIVTIRPGGNRSFAKGSEQPFLCEADANPPALYTWKRDGHVVGRQKPFPNIFIFRATDKTKGGTYTCEASNALGTSTASVTIDVQYPLKVTIQPSGNHSLPEGSRKEFNCTSDGKSVSYTWKKKGRKVDSQNLSGSFIFHAINKTMSGTYTCEASNGVVTGTAGVTIDIQYAPVVNIHPTGNYSIEKGREKILNCTCDANPSAEYRWKKDRRILVEQSSLPYYIVNATDEAQGGTYTCEASNYIGTTNASVTIHIVSSRPTVMRQKWEEIIQSSLPYYIVNASDEAQGGTYTCEASNHIGTTNASVTIHIVYAPVVTIHPSGNYSIQKGRNETFICSSEANPPALHEWKKDGHLIAAQNSQPASFILNATGETQGGTYTCESTNSLGKSTASVAVHILYAPVAIIHSSGNYKIVKGRQETLNCTSDANPPAVYTWVKDGHILEEPSYLPYYILNATNKTQSGTYTCGASNRIGNSTASVEVHILYAPTVTSQPSGNYRIQRGDTATFRCTSDANPPASYKWLKDGKSVAAQNSGSFILNATDKTQEGTYTCNATNQVGSSIANVTVHVLDPLAVYIYPSGNHSIEQGSQKTFNCTSNANLHTSYIWKRNGHVVANSSSSPGSFILQATDKTVGGTYTCEASNSVAIGTASVTIDVQYAPVVNIHPSGNYSVQKGSERTINCTSDANPPASHTWKKDDRIVATKRPLFSSFIFKATDETQGGTYTCEASNTIGNNTASVTIHIQADPDTGAVTSMAEVAGGAAGGSVVVIIVIVAVVVFIVIRRRKHKEKKSISEFVSNGKNKSYNSRRCEPNDLPLNEMYISADDVDDWRPEDRRLNSFYGDDFATDLSKGYCTVNVKNDNTMTNEMSEKKLAEPDVVYAQVNKNKGASNVPDVVYAQVDKSRKTRKSQRNSQSDSVKMHRSYEDIVIQGGGQAPVPNYADTDLYEIALDEDDDEDEMETNHPEETFYADVDFSNV